MFSLNEKGRGLVLLQLNVPTLLTLPYLLGGVDGDVNWGWLRGTRKGTGVAEGEEENCGWKIK